MKRLATVSLLVCVMAASCTQFDPAHVGDEGDAAPPANPGEDAATDAANGTDSGADAGVDAALEPDPLTATQQALLDAANGYRAALSPVPTPPLPPLTWFHEGAPNLQAWAAACNLTEGRRQVGSATRYSSLAVGSTPQDVIANLASGYTYSDNSCAFSNGNCVVPKALQHRNVTLFACGWNQCFENNTSFELWACAFAPDFDVDARPY